MLLFSCAQVVLRTIPREGDEKIRDAFNRFIRDARLFSALVVSGTQGNRSCEDSRRKRDSRMDCLSDAYQRAQDYTLRETTFVVVLACV